MNNKRYSRESYSQFGEDLIIEHLIYERLKNPTFIDIGSFHPWAINNTARLYLKGFNGINIEPSNKKARTIRKERPYDKTICAGIGSEEEKGVLYLMNNEVNNTFSEEVVEQLSERGQLVLDIQDVPFVKLEDVLKKNNKGKNPDIYSIDTIGMDLDVVKQINFDEMPPKIICINTLMPTGKKDIELIRYIQEKRYINYADTRANTIFVLGSYYENNRTLY